MFKRIFLGTVLLICLIFSDTGLTYSSKDRAFLLENLKQYSPKGYYILETYKKQERNPVDFMTYFDNSSELALMDSFNVTVHEFTHGYASLKGPDEIYVIVSPKESYRVPIGRKFPSRDMVTVFPQKLRTFRFSYIDTDEENLGTQVDGIYGLLDEMAAYLAGVETSVDFLPFYISQGQNADWGIFFETVDGSLYGILEFKLYILKYLEYAKEQRPDVFQDVLNNHRFIEAFSAIDHCADSLIRRYFSIREQVMAKLEKRGDYEFIDEPEMLQVIHNGESDWQGHFLNIYDLLSRELIQKKYLDLLGSEKYQAQYLLIAMDPYKKRFVPEEEITAMEEIFLPKKETDRPPVSVDQVVADRPEPPEQRSEPKVEAGKMSWKDEKGDIPYGFMDITEASVLVFEHELAFVVTFAALPSKLIFNNPNLKRMSLEYSWSVEIDQEGDGQNDFSLSIDRYKMSDDSPVEAPVMNYVQTGVWKIDQEGGGTMTEIPLLVDWKGNTVIFRVRKNEEALFGQVTENSKISFSTYYDDGRTVHRDSLKAD